MAASHSACRISADAAPADTLVFTNENAGAQVTEFYFYDADGQQIVGEVGAIGSG